MLSEGKHEHSNNNFNELNHRTFGCRIDCMHGVGDYRGGCYAAFPTSPALTVSSRAPRGQRRWQTRAFRGKFTGHLYELSREIAKIICMCQQTRMLPPLFRTGVATDAAPLRIKSIQHLLVMESTRHPLPRRW